MPNQKIVTENALSALASDIKNALSGKANSNDVYLKSQTYSRTEIDNALNLKADKSELYNVYPTDQESGAIASFTDGADNVPVKSLVSEIVAVQSGSGTPSPSNPRAISGFSQGVITVTDNDQITNTYTFTFGQTVYGGHFDNKGNLVVTYGMVDLGSLEWNEITSGVQTRYFQSIIDNAFYDSSQLSYLCECYSQAPIGSTGSDTGFYITSTNRIRIRDDAYATVYDFKTGMTGMKFVYPLANPITLSITSQDIPTLLGENNIFSNCGDVEVNYHADIGLYIDKKISSLAQA